MNYVPPFSVIRGSFSMITSKGDVVATIKYEELINIIRNFLAAIDVDEEWYCRNYPDIAAAIQAGQISSAREHFVKDGYFEGRLPFAMSVDEDWYLKTYSDIGDAVQQGSVASASEHFASFGYEEGRFPFKVI
jgi:hypothetical protein